MRAHGPIVGIAAVAVISGLGMPAARASTDEMPINGSFVARWIGSWAKTRESYHDEATVTSNWTITSTCTSPTDCTGQVSSDGGWTAPLRYFAGAWEVVRDIPNWEPCADGSAFPGHQVIRFYGVDEHGMVLSNQSEATEFAGEDKTLGPSGACGVNQWQVVRMPFTMRKVT